jgi:hypothetical protein
MTEQEKCDAFNTRVKAGEPVTVRWPNGKTYNAEISGIAKVQDGKAEVTIFCDESLRKYWTTPIEYVYTATPKDKDAAFLCHAWNKSNFNVTEIAEIPASIKSVPSTLDALISMLPLGRSTIGLAVNKTAAGVTFTIESVERVKQ